MVVAKHLQSSTYILTKVNSIVLCLKFTAFWFIPYYCHSPPIIYSHIALCKNVVTLVTNSSSSLYQLVKAFSYKSVFVKNLSQLCSPLSRLLLNSLLVNILLSSSILHIKRKSIGIDPASWPRSSQDRIIEFLLNSKTKLQKKNTLHVPDILPTCPKSPFLTLDQNVIYNAMDSALGSLENLQSHLLNSSLPPHKLNTNVLLPQNQWKSQESQQQRMLLANY